MCIYNINIYDYKYFVDLFGTHISFSQIRTISHFQKFPCPMPGVISKNYYILTKKQVFASLDRKSFHFHFLNQLGIYDRG